ncbi:MAG: hypothetical protein JNM55_14945 [Anaerolineales bacterium]|nr:hypothetical protein [Anaerolineales bacterium]
MKLNAVFILFGIGLFILFLSPQFNVRAQDDCVDAAGGVIPCPTAEQEIKDTPKPTAIPPTLTFTPSLTPTSTSTPSSTPTSTFTHTALPPTNTPSATPTATPVPLLGASAWMPGIGIGAFILLLIVGILLPAVQKIRVSQRE